MKLSIHTGQENVSFEYECLLNRGGCVGKINLHYVFTEVVGIFCIVFDIHHSIHNAPSANDSVRYSDIIWNKSLKIS